MWKPVVAGLVKSALFVVLAVYPMASALVASTIDIYFVEPGLKGALHVAMSLANAFLPSLAVYASLVAFFPSWRFLRIGLPGIAVLTLVIWVILVWQLAFGAFAKYPDTPVAWPLLAVGPIGIVGPSAFVFLLAWSRRPAVPPA